MDAIEEWRPLPEWEACYLVSSMGRVISLHDCQREKFLTGMHIHDGYRVIKLRDGERKANMSVHRMVLLTFVGPCPDGMEGCHGNGDSTDNRISNLRWDTPLANQADRKQHGTSGASIWRPQQLTDANVTAMRSNPYVTDKTWSETFNVTVQAIRLARIGQTFKHVPTPPLIKARGRGPKRVPSL